MFERRLPRIVVLLLVVALASSACAGPQASVPTPAATQLPAATQPPAATQAPTATAAPTQISGTVRMYKGPFGTTEKNVDDMMIAQFNKEFPGIKVTMDLYDWPTMQAQISTALASGSYDVIYIPSAVLPAFCYKGGPLLDLNNPAYANDPAWKSEHDIITGWQGMTAGDGTLCAAPMSAGVVSEFFVNEDLLKASGVPDDWYTSLDKVREAAITVHQTHPDVYGIAWRTGGLANFSYFDWYGYVLRSGADFLTPDQTACGLKKPELVQTFQWLVDLQKMKGVTPPPGEYSWDAQRGLFAAGKLAIMHDEVDVIYTYQDPATALKFNVQTFHVPGIVNNTAMGVAGTWAISAKAQDKAAAWTAVKWWESGEGLVKLMANNQSVWPARSDAMDPKYALGLNWSPLLKQAFQEKVTGEWATFPMNPHTVQFYTLVQPLFDEMMLGTITPQQLIDQACPQIEAALKQ